MPEFVAEIVVVLDTDLLLLGDVEVETVAVVVCACARNNSKINIIDRMWDSRRNEGWISEAPLVRQKSK